MSGKEENENEKSAGEEKDKDSQLNEIFKKKHHYAASVAAVFFILGLLVSPFTGMTGLLVGETPAKVSGESNIMAPQEVGEMIVQVLNERVVEGGGISLSTVEEEEEFYVVLTSYQGSEVPIFVSKDGQYWYQNAILIDDIPVRQVPTSPTSDKPVVDLFIWSYCPYGVSAQGPLADVAKLFGDKAEFNAVLYHDGHGPYETQQNKIQACIQQTDKDKYWDYASRFVEEIYPACSSTRDIECDKSRSIQVMNDLGIDSDAVMDCVDTSGATLVAQDRQYAGSLGVTGSPTLVINGVVTQPSARTAEAFKASVCQSFSNPPEECSETLSATAATTTGSC